MTKKNEGIYKTPDSTHKTSEGAKRNSFSSIYNYHQWRQRQRRSLRRALPVSRSAEKGMKNDRPVESQATKEKNKLTCVGTGGISMLSSKIYLPGTLKTPRRHALHPHITLITQQLRDKQQMTTVHSSKLPPTCLASIWGVDYKSPARVMSFSARRSHYYHASNCLHMGLEHSKTCVLRRRIPSRIELFVDFLFVYLIFTATH